MGVDKTNPVVGIKIVRDLWRELKLKLVVNMSLLVVEIDIQFFGYRQPKVTHDFTQHMPGDTVVLPVSISIAKNECFQVYLLEKRDAQVFCSIAFA